MTTEQQTFATGPRIDPQGLLAARPVLAVDPGSEQSAWMLYDGSRAISFGIQDNYTLLERLRDGDLHGESTPYDPLAIEMIASYGMPVGREVFETCVWIGRFIQAWSGPHELIYRREVKLHLCGQARAKDPNIRAALIDRFGPGREKAVGTKRSPGPLYGVAADVWSALAVAVTYSDRQGKVAA